MDLPEIRKALKQFAPRLACVEKKSGKRIKMTSTSIHFYSIPFDDVLLFVYWYFMD